MNVSHDIPRKNNYLIIRYEVLTMCRVLLNELNRLLNLYTRIYVMPIPGEEC